MRRGCRACHAAPTQGQGSSKRHRLLRQSRPTLPTWAPRRRCPADSIRYGIWRGVENSSYSNRACFLGPTPKVTTICLSFLQETTFCLFLEQRGLAYGLACGSATLRQYMPHKCLLVVARHPPRSVGQPTYISHIGSGLRARLGCAGAAPASSLMLDQSPLSGLSRGPPGGGGGTSGKSRQYM